MWQEDSQYIGYSTGWSRVAYAPASGGYLKVASQRSATAIFSFTGRSVAWVGSRAANRGKASLYVDGVFQKTVDLYAASTSSASVITSYVWPTSGNHRIQVVADGTAGRPTIDVDAFVRLT